ncbi:putative agc yank protein kinase [Lyophyllum shimeji]|uniref:Agc yank protein kinase n=1 Tax=Lyophyllum shimeji TaxID=47721 RepID=A0A9P3PVD3_LYOSH|nr:putative agc yank protein kinase [Lyophyllum shimeji]
MGAVCCRPQPIDFDGDVNLFHFVLLRCVGKGAFGKVDHPFIVNLRYAFQDDENCFFVIDLMLGGDLRFHLERLGSLQEDVVRFYVAQLSSALAFLHDNNIMHRSVIHTFPFPAPRLYLTIWSSITRRSSSFRDLKPDNILLDERGNAHLTDFNIAVHFGERRLTGVAGSMAYMAPEILTKRGYTYYIDWWSLGVCAYELIFGRRPFRGRTNSDLTYSISKDSLKWPEDAEKKCSRAGMQVLKGLLERDPSRRLACKPHGEGYQEFRRHPWFIPIDWDTLESKTQTPPFVPDAKKANFDASHELEELLLEDNPLKAKARKANQDNLSAEMRQMEDQFTSYDFKKMQRRSYYPHNQHIISTATGTSSGIASSRPGTPANDLRVDNGVSIAAHSVDGADSDGFRSEKVNSEKEYS